MQQFSIMFAARTGSSYLQTALRNHPHIICTDEDRLVQIVYEDKNHVQPGENIHPTADLQIPGCPAKSPAMVKFSGIKVPVTLQERYPFDHDFWQTNILGKPILLCTRNPLHSFISYKLVRANNDAWFQKEYTKPTHIDIAEAKLFIEGVNVQTLPFRGLPETLVLHYEDGVEEMYRQALRFLGAEYRPPRSRFIKQASRPLEELVSNYDELLNSEIGHLVR